MSSVLASESVAVPGAVPGAWDRLSCKPLSVQLLVLMAAAGAVLLAGLGFMAVDHAARTELTHARAAADMVQVVANGMARQGGLFVRLESSQDVSLAGRVAGSFEVSSEAADGSPTSFVFLRKTAAQVLADLSEQVAALPSGVGGKGGVGELGGIRFRLVAEGAKDVAMRAAAFDLTAMQVMRSRGASETWSVRDGQLHYSRMLKPPVGCANCIGFDTAVNAPVSAIGRARPPVSNEPGPSPGTDPGPGELAGLVAVAVPHQTWMGALANQGTGFWGVAALFSLLLAAASLAIERWLLRPLVEQTRYAEAISSSQDLGAVRLPAPTAGTPLARHWLSLPTSFIAKRRL